MKTLLNFAGLILLIVGTTCTSSRSQAQIEADDRYYSLADARKEQRQMKKLASSTPSRGGALKSAPTYNDTDQEPEVDNRDYQQFQDNNSSGIGSNNQNSGRNFNNNGRDMDSYYDMDDYYDYMYSSRIRRFHRNQMRFGYYDPFFTNMFWYNHDPFMFGTSIHSTYGFFNPFVPWGWNTMGMGMGMGMGPGFGFGWNSFTGWNMNLGWGNPWMFNNPWRWNTWGYNPMMSPFAYNPWMFNSWGMGMGMNAFNAGFNQGLYTGLLMNSMNNSNSVYYNSFDNNTTVVNNFGPNTGQNSSGGSSFAPISSQNSLNQTFAKEIGPSVSAVRLEKFQSDSKLPSSDKLNSQKIPANNVSKAQAENVQGGKVNTDARPQSNKLETGLNPDRLTQQTTLPSQDGRITLPQEGKDRLISSGTSPANQQIKDSRESITPVTGLNQGTRVNDNRLSTPDRYTSAPVRNQAEKFDRAPNIRPDVQYNGRDNSNAIQNDRANQPVNPGRINNAPDRSRITAPDSRQNINNQAPNRDNQYQRFDNRAPQQQLERNTQPRIDYRSNPNTPPADNRWNNAPSNQQRQNLSPQQRPQNRMQANPNQQRPQQYQPPAQQQQRQYSTPPRQTQPQRQQSQPSTAPSQRYNAPRQQQTPRMSSPSPRMSSPSSPQISRPSAPSSPRMSAPSSPRMSSPSSPRMNSGGSSGTRSPRR